MQLLVERHRLAVECRSAGRLVPWMGPAFRGITAVRYRAAECRQPADLWRTTWRYCRGCDHLRHCGYGIAFEPWRTTAGGGTAEAPRPLVVTPAFPAPGRAVVGTRLPIEITAIGTQAAAAVPGVIAALAAAGNADGLGPDRVRFGVLPAAAEPSRMLVRAADLPKAASASPLVANVVVRLTGPLFLREAARPGASRRIAEPGLRHLVRASMRAARDFLGDGALCPGRGHLDLDDLAGAITPAASDIGRFAQEKASRRSMERFDLDGVTGSWFFRSLPACLVAWLQLGGLLHVGGHRIAGAGGWELDFRPAGADGGAA